MRYIILVLGSPEFLLHPIIHTFIYHIHFIRRLRTALRILAHRDRNVRRMIRTSEVFLASILLYNHTIEE